jgi:hypothetical protein
MPLWESFSIRKTVPYLRALFPGCNTHGPGSVLNNLKLNFVEPNYTGMGRLPLLKFFPAKSYFTDS